MMSSILLTRKQILKNNLNAFQTSHICRPPLNTSTNPQLYDSTYRYHTFISRLTTHFQSFTQKKMNQKLCHTKIISRKAKTMMTIKDLMPMQRQHKLEAQNHRMYHDRKVDIVSPMIPRYRKSIIFYISHHSQNYIAELITNATQGIQPLT